MAAFPSLLFSSLSHWAKAPAMQAISSISHLTHGQPPPDDSYIVPMPKLSHRMTQGKIIKWLKRPGDKVNQYDILFEVSTHELVEEVFKVDKFASSVSLLVESQEDGYLARILVDESDQNVTVGAPVALFVESEEALRKAVDELPATWKPQTSNVYDAAQPRVNVLPWQSYLKEASRKVKCMG